MRTIARIRNNILCLFNIEIRIHYKTNLSLKQATLMTEYKESIVNSKKLGITKCWQIFGKIEILDELDFLDNDVDWSLRQIAKFHFNIKHPKSFDKAFHDLDKPVKNRRKPILIFSIG
jgi:hypothetical protein